MTGRYRSVGAFVPDAVRIKAQGVIRDGKPLGFGDGMLAFFNLGIVKLLDFSAVKAYQMVVMIPFVEFIDRFATFKMTAAQDVGLFKLGQHPIDGGQSDIRTVFQQNAKNILRRHVPLGALLENFQNFQTGQGGLEPCAFEFINIGHGAFFVPVRALLPKAQPLQSPDHIATLHHMFSLQRRRACLSLLVCASASLVACGSFNNASNSIVSVVTPYKIDIVQGNFVSKEQAAAIKPGMSRPQVRDILGTPLLTSVFHADRWDYVFTFKRQGLQPQARKITLFFKGESLDRIEADPLPSEAEFVASVDSGRKMGKVPVLEMTPESVKQLPLSNRNAESKPLPPLPASYPPLESVGR